MSTPAAGGGRVTLVSDMGAGQPLKATPWPAARPRPCASAAREPSRAGKERSDAHRDGAQSREAWLRREAAVQTNWPLLRKATWFQFSKKKFSLPVFFF